MIVAWRTVRAAYAGSAFSGEGARLFGGRWNRIGTPVVYLAEHRSLAVLEVITQALDAEDAADLLIASATFSESDIETLDPLPDGWNAHPPTDSTVDVGTRWAVSRRSLFLRVPSVVLPAERNYLLNPRHPDIERVTLGVPEALGLDPRLVRRQA